MGKRRIFVNADMATVGTVVHEFLHFCTSIEFSEASLSHKLLYEGPTEYFTRLAQPAIDRTPNHPAEHHTIHKLVSDGEIPGQPTSRARPVNKRRDRKNHSVRPENLQRDIQNRARADRSKVVVERQRNRTELASDIIRLTSNACHAFRAQPESEHAPDAEFGNTDDSGHGATGEIKRDTEDIGYRCEKRTRI